jgi:hypothetical protein
MKKPSFTPLKLSNIEKNDETLISFDARVPFKD